MAEKSDDIYDIPEEPVYNGSIRKLKNSDPANAETVFNPLLQQMIENTHAVKTKTDDLKNGFNNYKEEIAGQIGSIIQLNVEYEEETETILFTSSRSGTGEGMGGNYVLPVASDSILGGVKIGDGIDIGPEGHISTDTDAIVKNIENNMEEISEEDIKGLFNEQI